MDDTAHQRLCQVLKVSLALDACAQALEEAVGGSLLGPDRERLRAFALQARQESSYWSGTPLRGGTLKSAPRRCLTMNETAAALGVSRTTLERNVDDFVRAGLDEVNRVGRKRFFTAESVNDVLHRTRVGGRRWGGSR